MNTDGIPGCANDTDLLAFADNLTGHDPNTREVSVTGVDIVTVVNDDGIPGFVVLPPGANHRPLIRGKNGRTIGCCNIYPIVFLTIYQIPKLAY